MSFQDFFSAYVEAALWSSHDDDGNPLDDRYGREDIAPEALAGMRAECEDFYNANAGKWDGKYPPSKWSDDARAGHDFWLTRNGHGAGFWDRGLGALGKELTDACKPYGESDLYIGGDMGLWVHP